MRPLLVELCVELYYEENVGVLGRSLTYATGVLKRICCAAHLPMG